MTEGAATARVLARCNGFAVAANGEVIGAVATPVFSEANLLPDYLLVRLAPELPGAYRAIPPALIRHVDAAAETVYLDIESDDVAELPEADVLRLAPR